MLHLELSGKFFVTLMLFQMGGIAIFLHAQMLKVLPRHTSEPKFVVISSDDWGRWADAAVIWPNLKTKKEFLDRGGSLQDGIFAWEFATVESQNSMISFFNLLLDLNKDISKYEHKVVLTPFFTVGGPNFREMRRLGCPDNQTCEYVESLIHNDDWGLSLPPFSRGDLRSIYKDGFQMELWHPEYHGLSHFNYKNWIEGLKENDKDGVLCFELGTVCLSDRLKLRSECIMDDSPEGQIETFKRGINGFENFIGYKPKAHSSPHNLSGRFLLQVLKKLDFWGVDSEVQDETPIELSKFNRMRYDPFASDFFWESAWENMKRELITTNTLVLAYHAQNTFDMMYSKTKHKELLNIFKKTIRSLREEFPNLVFLTSSELHQIQTRGWSQEVWHNSIIYRNYKTNVTPVTMSNLKDFYNFGKNWKGENLILENVNNIAENQTVFVGQQVLLQPHTTYRLRTFER